MQEFYKNLTLVFKQELTLVEKTSIFQTFIGGLSMKKLLLSLIFVLSCTGKTKEERSFMDFMKEHELKARDLSKELNLVYFNASISGKKEDYDKYSDLNIKLTKIYSDKEAFRKIEAIKEKGNIKHELLNRELETVYRQYKSSQIDDALLEELIKLQAKVESNFSSYRVKLNGKELSDNEIDTILRTSKDSKELEGAWLASKEIGAFVEADVKKLVGLRNKTATILGFRNYHEMSLYFNEQSQEEIDAIFEELDTLTSKAFAEVKDSMDEVLAKNYSIEKEKLMPWHYQNKFFQEAPKIYDVDFDKYYKGEDIVAITQKFYDGIGLNIDDVINQSDLFEKPGKYQHAYCTNIDRIKDVRVVCNIKDNHYWAGTSLHEFGHATYDYYLGRNLPWVLKEPAHIFTTEAVAMMFQRLVSNPSWIAEFISDKAKLTDLEELKKASFQSLRLEKLVFSRWAQVVYRFEKGMYENPEQDLNKLWWDLVSKYQLLKKPDARNKPDYASKIHIALYPVYYHNYLLGDVLASQLQYYLVDNITKTKNINDETFKDNKSVGEFFMKMFEMGRRYYWNDMIARLTGEKLTAKYYAKQFVE